MTRIFPTRLPIFFHKLSAKFVQSAPLVLHPGSGARSFWSTLSFVAALAGATLYGRGTTAQTCCTPGVTACQNVTCVQCVNNVMGSSLCGSFWGSQCVYAAAKDCAAACGCPACGDGKCTAPESCVTCPQDCGACANSCCAAASGPGCSDPLCMDCVCEFGGGYTSCCSNGWNVLCAAKAILECADQCSSCNTCGNGICESHESCSLCAQDCGACAGSCCAAHSTAGCSDAQCQECVCDTYTNCCVFPWDSTCVSATKGLCAASCTGCSTCGDGVCVTEESCTTCPADCGTCDQYCCGAHAAAGCSNAACEACVCAKSGLGFCCSSTWGELCAGVAATDCSAECGCSGCGNGVCNANETCYSCPQDCGQCKGSCCVVHGSPGCDVQECMDCVVDVFPACGYDGKDSVWYGNCAATAASTCVGSCPTCNKCGDGKCTSTENCASCPGDCGPCTGSCCQTNPTVGCSVAACQTCVCEQNKLCCSTPWGDGCAQIAGSAACAAVCPGCKPCGNGSCDVAGGENCQSCPEDCGACPKNCCAAHGGVGCETALCQTCVCQIDEPCCTTLWDSGCAALAASSLCASVCPSCDVCGNGYCSFEETCLTCPADCGQCTGDCCSAHPGQGCEDPTCTDCVCTGLGTCCWYKSSWKQNCADQAATTCAPWCSCDVCGNGLCGPEETCSTCPADCQNCGDGVCECLEDCANCPSDCGGCPYNCPVGDPNGDGLANVTDVQCGILVALAALAGQGTPWPGCLAAPLPNACDVDCNATTDVTDVLLLIGKVLVKPLDGQLDSNQNACVDACENAACGDGLCIAAEDLGNCFKDCAHPAAGCCAPGLHLPCTDSECLGCMCQEDSKCCTFPSSTCNLASSAAACAPECGCGTSCCAPGGVGCLQAACAACVCAKDSACCTVSWDTECVALAKDVCKTPCGCP